MQSDRLKERLRNATLAALARSGLELFLDLHELQFALINTAGDDGSERGRESVHE